MKKYIFLPVLALALGFTACEDDDTLGIPVVNPEIPAVDAKLVSVAPSAEMPAVISLQAYNDADKNFPVATITAGEDWPAGYTFGVIAQVSRDENFSQTFEIPATISGSTITINPDDLQGVIYNNYTRDPGELTLWLRYGVEAINGKEVIRLGDATSFIGVQQIKVVPFTPTAVIEPKYYLIYSNDSETWTKAHALELTRGSGSQYDNPNFSLICNFSADELGDGIYWKVIPESTYTDFNLETGTVIGVVEADAESREGKLDTSADQFAGYLDLTGPVKFDFNLDFLEPDADGSLKFTFMQAIENFWLAGDNVNGLSWSFASEPTMMTLNYVDYAGFANLGSEFKFAPQAGWGGDFGTTDNGQPEFSTNDSGEFVGKGMCNGGDNVKVAEPGFYYIGLNYSNKELNLVKITGFGIIGGFNGWGESVAMTASENNMVYTVTQALNEGDEWKFRANNAWTVSLGGDLDNLSPFNGSNIVCRKSGTYEITLDLRTLPWTAKLVEK